jgi:hypothetical protein
MAALAHIVKGEGNASSVGCLERRVRVFPYTAVALHACIPLRSVD